MSFNLPDQQKVKQDYYTFLGLSNNATETEITNAYRKLSKIYHPDKHEEQNRAAANILFNRAKKAYEVLKDPQKRAIYDALGEEALSENDTQIYEIVKHVKSAEEIKSLYELLMKENEEKQLKHFLNPRGTVSIGIDAKNLFRKKSRRKRKLIRFTSMGLTAAIDFPLNNKNRLTLTGLVTSDRGNGEHTFTAAIKNSISEDLKTEWHLAIGQNDFLKFKGSKNLTEQDIIGTTLVFSPELFGLFKREINYVHLLSKYLHFDCALKTDIINDSSFSTSFVYDKNKNKIDLEFSIGIKSSYLSLAYIRSLNLNETKLITRLKYNFINTSIEYGCETKLTKHSSVDALVSFNTGSGVGLKIALILSNQAYAFNIALSDEMILGPIVYGTVCPMLAYLIVKKYIIEKYQQTEIKRKSQEISRDNLKQMYERRRDAELSIQLMKDSYLKSLKIEQEKENGLIIDYAIYGYADYLLEFVNKNIRDQSIEQINLNDFKDELIMKKLILVTIPLQCLIKDSKLLLPETTKSNLPGFYDPCPNRDKKLYIRYKFRNNLKEIFCFDDQFLRLPTLN